ncbi:ATP-dependent Clp protease ATP-binding subunit [bacterium]|nr:ATP-dependent Clp protease ATP-binding subunit [bacterium]
MKDRKKEIDQFITCPKCGGSGRGKINFSCFDCGGMGYGIFFINYFIYWNHSIDQADILWRRLIKKILKSLNFLSIFITLVGILSLSFWIWSYNTEKMGEYLLFWEHKNVLILSFWIGVLSFLFFIFRTQREKEEKNKIEELKINSSALPNNWKELKGYGKKYNVLKALSEESLDIVENSFLLAKKYGHKEINNLHLFYCLLDNSDIRAMFIRLNIDLISLKKKIDKQLSQVELLKIGVRAFSMSYKKTLIKSFEEAYSNKQISLGPVNIISYCIVHNEMLTEILWDFDVNQDKIMNVKAWFRTDERIRGNLKIFRKMARYKPKKAMDRAYTAMATPNLNKISYDLTLAAKWGRLGLCVARDREIKNILDFLKSKNNSAILSGPPGVGKKTIIHGIARAMVKEDVPEFLKDKRLLELDASRLISGADASLAEQRMLIVLDEISRAGNIVLYIENINQLIGISSGKEGSMDLSEVLSSALEKQGLYCLATTDDESYNKYVENTSLGRTMSRFKIEEPRGNQAIQIIESKIGKLEYKYNVFFTYNSLDKAVQFSDRYIHYSYLPEKAIDILEKTAIRVSKTAKSKKQLLMCGQADVAETVKEITQIPVDEVDEDEGEKLMNLEREIHKYMINQNEAVDMVANSLRRARTNMRETKRTIANFLFLGPTGVGKTELAKTVARVYFGRKDCLIRVDMSEYQHVDSVTKMIGDGKRPGYLTEAVRKNPFSLVLLDEFEKAHPKILNLFLQVTDDGRLTDGNGRTIDFTNCVIIVTSNIASNFIKKKISEGWRAEEVKNKVIEDKLSEKMRPELVNRFDGVIIFKPLSMNNVVEITKLLLKKTEKMLENKGIYFEAYENGIKQLAREGYDVEFGARPLKRLLQKRVNNIIAKKILSGEIKRRDKIIINNEARIIVAKGKEL